MRYLHAMLRVRDVEASLHFFQLLGLQVLRKKDYPEGRFSLIFLACAEGEPEIELTHNWDQSESYGSARNFGHLAFEVDDIFELCHRLQTAGIVIHRPPRDGRMAFIRSPDAISVELLQKGKALAPQEPWLSMPNTGTW